MAMASQRNLLVADRVVAEASVMILSVHCIFGHGTFQATFHHGPRPDTSAHAVNLCGACDQKVMSVVSDLWVFGYGSLIWRPGFEHKAAYPARLYGFHRSLCVYSHVHRGTPERPGLVMGLDRGGSCHGMVFHVDSAHHDDVLRYLREREQATNVYLERTQPVHILERSGDRRQMVAPQTVEAVTYCVDRTHIQYAGTLTREVQLDIVQGAVGQSGVNPDYVTSTCEALDGLGVHDATLRWLSERLQTT